MTGLMRMKRKTLFRSPAPVAFLKMASQLKAVKSYIGLGIIVGVLTGCATGGVKIRCRRGAHLPSVRRSWLHSES
jgi:hypothetical protein